MKTATAPATAATADAFVARFVLEVWSALDGVGDGMPALVRGLTRSDGPAALVEYLALLRGACDTLAGAGRRFMADFPGAAEVAEQGQCRRWGSGMKRAQVQVGSHALIGVSHHPLAEIVNQCATLERLLDAIEWCGSPSGLSASLVLACHPTITDDGEFDLWVEGSAGEAVFEVSDVAAKRNNNRKIDKDIVKLRRAPNDVATYLTTSPELNCWIGERTDRFWAARHVWRPRVVSNDDTVILRIDDAARTM